MSFIKTCKKICCFIAVLVVLGSLAACGGTVTESERTKNKKAAEAAVAEIQKALTWDPTAMVNITKAELELTTVTKHDNVTVSWESSDEEIISTSGEVTRILYSDPRAELNIDGDYVTPVTLTAKITGTYSYKNGEETITNEVVAEKEFNFTVKCLKPEITGTVKECKDAAWDYIYNQKGANKDLSSDSSTVYNVEFTAIVTAKLLNGGMGITVHDGTEGIYVYTNNEGFEVGDTVHVVGNIYRYYGSLQVGSDITIKKVDAVEGMQIGEYRELSVQEWEDEQADLSKSIGYFGGKLVKIYAKLEVSSNDSTEDVYKLVDPITGEVAWVYYKSYESGNEDLAAWDGKYVYIYGATYNRDSRLIKNHLLWNGKIEEAPAPQLTDAQKVGQVKAQLSALSGDYVSGSKLALPASNEEYGATITWAISDATLYADGKFAVVEKDSSLTATATITVGEVTETYEVKLTVKALTLYTVSQIADLEKDAVVKLEGTVDVVFSKYNNFYLKDATGNLLVYKSLPEGIKVGDKVELVGTVGFYNGTPQIASIISCTLVQAGEWSMAAPTKATVEEIASYTEADAPYGAYLLVRGVLVKSEKYYYLASAANKEIKISLYNSTVDAEKLVAVADTETEVSLVVYFYGNSKSDWTQGEKRVVFVQREGEYFVGDETVVVPEKKEYANVAEAKALATKDGAEVVVRGVVSHKGLYSEKYGNFGAMIQDATGALYIYRVSGQDAYDALVVGDEVELKGLIKIYNGLYELTNVTVESIKVVSAGVGAPEAGVMSNELADQAKIVVLEKALYDGKAFWKNGVKYAYYYSSDWLAEKPELKAGNYYTIKGWVNWYNNAQITPVAAVTEVALADVPAEEHTNNVFATVSVKASVSENFELPEGFTWSVVSGTGIAVEGLNATVTQTSEDQTVVLKAELNGASKEFTVVVLKKVEGAPETKEVTYTWVSGSGSISEDAKTLTIDCGDFVITLFQNTSSSKPANTYDQIRFYQGHILTITAKEGKEVVSVSFTDIGGKKPTQIIFSETDTNLSYVQGESNLWTVNSDSPVASVAFSSDKQIRFTSITVVLADAE